MNGKIPVSVLVMTRNEEKCIARCLTALRDFDEIVVVDSGSADATSALAADAGAQVVNFRWSGRYPKKRQWCLDNLSLRNGWILFVDADEIVTGELAQEIRGLGFNAAGYFIDGLYVMDGKVLRHGLRNRKIALLNRRMMEFPVVDDLDLPGMGEIEGHYQPVLKTGFEGERIGCLKEPLLHYAYEGGWHERHERYAAWECGMNARNAWPADPVPSRQALKRLFRALPGRGVAAFLHSYALKGGFFEGKQGFRMARDRYRYYRMVQKQLARK